MRNCNASNRSYPVCPGTSVSDMGPDFTIAMAYVPWQHFSKICENLEKGYQDGTIFPELNKPFTGRRCVK